MNDSDLVEVRLIGIPLSIHRIATEYQDGLDREFALLSMQAGADPQGVPTRLVSLSRQLRERFKAFSEGPRAQLEAALERGDEEMDLAYLVPPDAAPAIRQLGDLLAEADAYCMAGKELLTLVAPGNVVRYRAWIIEEFERQIAGQPPRPFSEFDRSSL